MASENHLAILATVSALALGALLSACVHEEIKPPRPTSNTTLTITRSGTTSSLGWKSEQGRVYTVMYTEKLSGGPWQVLPGAANLSGTGDYMTFRDDVPNGTTRYYRLQVQHGVPRNQK
jgi:hypothetical protein